jgi:hypothetical protein
MWVYAAADVQAIRRTRAPTIPLRQGDKICVLATDHSHRENTMNLSSSIFKAYDIRGIVPSTINEDVARGLGRAFGTMLPWPRDRPRLPWGGMAV